MTMSTEADVGRFEPEYHEYYCWSPDTVDGTERTEWYVLDAADDHAVAGPLDIDAAIRKAADLNKELESK